MHSLPFSFDTIKIVVPLKDPDRAKQLLPSSTHFLNLNKDQSLRSEYLSSWFWPTSAYDMLPSDTSVPVVRWQSCADCEALSFEASIPKAVIGHSAGHIYSLSDFAKALEQVLLSFGVEPSVPYTEYRVRRLDICLNFAMDSLEHAREAYQQLARLRYRGRIGIVKGRESLAYWPSKTCTVKFYVKWDEMIRKSQGYDSNWLESHSAAIKPILRHEQEWKGKKLSKFVGVTKIDQVTVSALEKAFAKTTFSERLDVLSKFSSRTPMGTLSALYKAIATTKRPVGLTKFATSLLDNGYEVTRRDYSKTAFYRYCKKLRDLGYDPAFVETHWDKEFQPCLDLSDYFSPERLTTSMDEVVYTGNFFYDYFRAFYQSDVSAKPLNPELGGDNIISFQDYAV